MSLKYAGYHCSWCLTPEGISVKLQSAIHQDFPRWGDYPDKLDIEYLTNLTQTGFQDLQLYNFVLRQYAWYHSSIMGDRFECNQIQFFSVNIYLFYKEVIWDFKT